MEAARLEVLVGTKGIEQATKGLRDVDDALRKTAGQATRTSNELDDTGKRGSKSLGGLKKVAGLLGGVAVGAGLAKGMRTAIDEFEEARKVGALTTNVIKSTGGAANVTAKQVGDLAMSISNKVGMDDEAIQSGANLLLCLEDTAEALTKNRGWVTHDQLSVGDEILAYDPEDDTTRWEPIRDFYRYEVDTELIRWQSKQIDVATTPHHRWWTEGHNANARYVPKFQTTEEITGKQVRVKIGGGQPGCFAESKTYSDDFIELLGWVHTEGTFPPFKSQVRPARVRQCSRCGVREARNRAGVAVCDDCSPRPIQDGRSQPRARVDAHSSRHARVSFSQSQTANPQNVACIRALVERLVSSGHKISETQYLAKYNDATVSQWGFSGGLGRDVRSALPDKKLTPELLSRLTAEQAQLLLDVLVLADGHVDHNGGRQFIQKDRAQLDLVEMLAAMLGIRTSRLGRGDATYFCATNHLRGHQVNATRERYQGVVWCPQIRTQIFFARNRGKTFWTGNTFKNIRNETGKGRDVFNQATAAAVDLSAAGFGSLSSTSKQLGKALNDPVKGMTALGRSGVTFSEDQKKAIAALMETGKAADRVRAQQMILKEVQSQVGGAAAAQATPMDRLRVTMGNLAEKAGTVLVPMLDKGAQFLTKLLDGMMNSSGAGGAIVDVFKAVGGAIGETVATIRDIVDWFREHKTVTMALAGAMGVLVAAFIVFKVQAAIQALLAGMAGAFWALNAAMAANPIGLVVVAIAALVAGLVIAYRESETFRAIVDAVFSWLKGAATTVFGFLASFITGVWNVISTVTSAVWGAISGFLSTVFNAIKAVVTTVFPVISAVITGVWGVISTVTSTIWNAIQAVLTTIWTAISTTTTTVWNAIKSTVSGVWEGIKSVATTVWNAIKSAVTTPITAARDALTAVWNTIRDFLAQRWENLKANATAAWNAIRDNILTPIRSARDAVGDVIEGIWNRFKTGFGRIIEGALAFAGTIKEALGDAFRGAANIAIGFINGIIKAINLIPGVNIGLIDKIKEETGKGKGGPNGNGRLAAQGLAHGGAFARTGGFVNQPITLMGEEAPRRPEFVIPTNPAYRGRALKLWQRAGQSIGAPVQGLAKGGTFESTSYGPPWTGINGTGVTATGVDLRPARKAYGVAVDPNVIALGSSFPISPNPFGYSGQFKAFDTGSAIKGNRLDFYDWRGRAEQLGWGRRAVKVGDSSGGGGIGAAIGAALTGAAGALFANGPGAILDKLPGVGDLPDWLKGTGKYVLDKASDFIKTKVAGLGGGGGGGGGASGKPGGGGAGTFDGRPVANWIIPILNWARRNGWGGSITSGVRTAAHNAAVGGAAGSNHLTTAYPGGAVDVGGWGARAEGAALARVLAGYEGPRKLIWAGPTIGDWGHFSATGNKMGGVYGTHTGLLGSFAAGTDYVPRTGAYELHKGESVTPSGQKNDALIKSNDRLAAELRDLRMRGVAVVTLTDRVGDELGDRAVRRSATGGDPNITHQLY